MAGELYRSYRAQNQNVFVLAFHVDYWNHLHWNDPYSSRAYTDRQRAYARILDIRSLYTPQMVINGQIEFTGSNRSKALKAIDFSLASSSAAKIELEALSPQATPAFQLNYRVTGADTGTDIHFALVEGGLVRKIGRGENAGKTLRHEHVVRAFRTEHLDGNMSATTAVNLPRDLKFRNAKIVVYTQQRDSGHITAAAELSLQ
ncbi:MAG: DUF1223 domain-containing protein [Deferribacteres bacterium]|nr:DUF1223 domain-containing protein [candidate division KSB1 bacterium]MCB9510822.1 DUF1223 domain-containing protein [Deferribacteres bacterium]